MRGSAVSSESEDSLEVGGPLGVRVTAKGGELRLILLVVAAFALVLWLGYLHHVRTEDGEQQLTSRLNEMVYLLSLTQEERTRLDIAMPESLRQKVRRKEDR